MHRREARSRLGLPSGTTGSAEDPIRLSPEQYLDAYGVTAYLQDAMTLVLENRPQDPILFISEYFRHAVQGSSYVHRSFQYLRQTELHRQAFMDNAAASYHSLMRRKGSIGVSGEELGQMLKLLTHDFPTDLLSDVLVVLSPERAAVVSFDQFVSAVSCCMLYEEVLEVASTAFSTTLGAGVDDSADILKKHESRTRCLTKRRVSVDKLLAELDSSGERSAELREALEKVAEAHPLRSISHEDFIREVLHLVGAE